VTEIQSQGSGSYGSSFISIYFIGQLYNGDYRDKEVQTIFHIDPRTQFSLDLESQ